MKEYTQKLGRGIALLFHNHGTRKGWVFSSTLQPYFTPGKDPVHIVQETGWVPGPENLASAGIRSPDRPARSQSLYRMSYREVGSITKSRHLWITEDWESTWEKHYTTSEMIMLNIQSYH
jgi:hypothetical protein